MVKLTVPFEPPPIPLPVVMAMLPPEPVPLVNRCAFPAVRVMLAPFPAPATDEPATASLDVKKIPTPFCALVVCAGAVAVSVNVLPALLASVFETGVTRLGDVANTAAPVPVSSVNAAARFALVGVPRKVATPVPNPEIPVETGSPVIFVATPLAGVPSAGVTSVGDVANTAAPVPVSSVNAVARFALVGVPRNVATPEPLPSATPLPAPSPLRISVVDEIVAPPPPPPPPEVVICPKARAGSSRIEK